MANNVDDAEAEMKRMSGGADEEEEDQKTSSGGFVFNDKEYIKQQRGYGTFSIMICPMIQFNNL